MFLSKLADRLLELMRESRRTDTLGSAAAAVGIILVALGIFLQESGVGFGAAISALGGALLLGGLGAVLFVKPRRRAGIIGAARRIARRYEASTAGWRWQDRYGLAGILIGLALLAPALVMQILFGTIFGVIVVSPGLVLFWAGVALLVYGRFNRGGGTGKPGLSSYAPPSRRDGRGGRR